MAKDLVGKTALITGGTSGIGLAVGTKLLERGARVMFVGYDGRTPEAREAFRAEVEAELLKDYPAEQFSVAIGDVADAEEMQKVADATAELDGHGKIDILINNAGIQIQAPLVRQEGDEVGENGQPKPVQTPGTWNLLLGINLTGKFNTLHAALPYLKEAGKHGIANVINTSSVHGHVGSDERAPYVAAMHGTIGLTKVMAVDLAPFNIKAHSVSPAFIDTPLAHKPLDEKVARGEFNTKEEAVAWRLKHQGGKWVEMEDVINAYTGLIDGTNPLDSGQDVLLDKGRGAEDKPGYIENANKTGGIAIFDNAPCEALNQINQRRHRSEPNVA